jgi:hypothetical protein
MRKAPSLQLAQPERTIVLFPVDLPETHPVPDATSGQWSHKPTMNGFGSPSLALHTWGRSLPYGIWNLPNGEMIWHDRDYRPLVRFMAAIAVEAFSGDEWINGAKQSEPPTLYTDGNPPWTDRKTRANLEELVAAVGVVAVIRWHARRRLHIAMSGRVRRLKSGRAGSRAPSQRTLDAIDRCAAGVGRFGR